MAAPHEEIPPLQIRCPSCSQRFKVGADLLGRTVECGGCEHRFRIDEETVVRIRKLYPGERAAPSLSRYQRVPLATAPPVGLQTIQYSIGPDPALIEPVSPQRIFAGATGVAMMLLVGLLLMFGAETGGILDGMSTVNRLVMAGFTVVLGAVLLVYANPKARVKAVAFSALLGSGLLALPFFFTGGSERLAGRVTGLENAMVTADPGIARVAPLDDALARLRDRIGTDPLVKEADRLAEVKSNKRALGLWLIDLRQSNLIHVRDYIFRLAGADPSSHLYPREGGNYLMVVTGIELSLEELAAIASPLGTVGEFHPEIGVVEVKVNNENFVEGPMDKLANKQDPAFYDLNKRELESIQLARVSRAVQRLADAEPRLYRSDITRKLISLLGEDGIDFQGDICRALSTWSEQKGPAGEAAAKVVKKLHDLKKPVPADVMALCVKEGNSSVLPILGELWIANPTAWEAMYGDYGPVIEVPVLEQLPQTKGSVKQSAVRLLGKIGGPRSLAALEAVAPGADQELSVLIEQARRSIIARQGR